MMVFALKYLHMFVFINISFLLANLGGFARLIPEDEVKTLEIISKKLKNSYWEGMNQKSCSDGGVTFNKTISSTAKIFSNVTCDCSFNSGTICHVITIQMKGLNLSGIVPEEFGNLTHLTEIDLSRNFINGPIPKSLTRIPLVLFSLTGNRNSGPIPDEIGQITTLKKFVVEDNRFSGSIPKSFGNLKNMEKLVLAANFFNGTLPDTFSNLNKLTELRLNGNAFSGTIPDFLGNLANLTTLDIQGTSMTGPIPSSLSSLTNLINLRISDLNAASLTFPNLTGMPNLKELILRNCSITGQVPDYIGNLTQLKTLDLSYNQLSGSIPESIQNIVPLVNLFLSNNLFSGQLPSWILNSKHVGDVSYNNFTGLSVASCQQSNINFVSSHSSSNSNSNPNPGSWCMLKGLPCSTKPQYHSLFINCGGKKTKFEGDEYEEDSSPGGPSFFISSGGENWAYSSTGVFLYTDAANFVATETSNNNNNNNSVTGIGSIFQTARLAPTALKYYGLCLLKGSYTVTLHFAEIMYSSDATYSSLGRRIFDVSIQGRVVLKDFDIAATAGGAGKPVTKVFENIEVDDSTLEIFLYWAGQGTTALPYRGEYGPLLSAISVKSNFKVSTATTGLSAGAVAGIVIASFVVVVSVLVILWMRGYLCGKADENEEFRHLGTGYFSLKQIKTATDNFSIRNKIGEGGFGPVYKGILADGKVIAVKQLSSKSKQGNREFVNEIGMISALQHPNLVKLHGCCIEGKELLLVYEYMENNSLARAIFGTEEQKLRLDWPTRRRICLGIARGLAYLHEESRLKIVHRDIKATNVLLDKDLNAKISDFGLAKLDEEENTHISTRIAGTIGYMAPEYAMRGYLTDKADVYSFGVVVLEIVSGTSNTSYRPKDEFVYLLDWAYVLQEQGSLLELVDPSLGPNYPQEEAQTLLNLALLCTNPSPTLRPTMSSVVKMIDGKIPVQAPIVRRLIGAESNDEELRRKAFERLSVESQTAASMSSSSDRVERSMSMDGSWVESSISSGSMPSKNDTIDSTRLLPNLNEDN